jgi:hypothetical protein
MRFIDIKGYKINFDNVEYYTDYGNDELYITFVSGDQKKVGEKTVSVPF